MQEIDASKQPRVFLSYSQSAESQRFVHFLADKLENDGVNVRWDQKVLQLGDRLPHFMDDEITNAQYVLIICSPDYKQKADNRAKGVGYESNIISAELYAKNNERKFIPILLDGTFESSMPTFLAGKMGVDMRPDSDIERGYNDLITTLKKKKAQRKKSINRDQPSGLTTPPESRKPETPLLDQDVKIMGIVIDEVTLPKLDGTRGSALYRVPFKLSRWPSARWANFFHRYWEFPRSFSTMHRQGIASVNGDRIILDGTTLDEVRDYHRETLLICVEDANKDERACVARENAEKQRREQQVAKHRESVAEIAASIHWD
ncbi:hypothetical protein JOD55_000525 [Arcanobacterium pluranimalium]|uniref:toll/interleukin-1 receptor domain-containing protein n=1 Tax=Arcanobacterium pluranimalium TaxID=108028 RepID=UPI0019596E4D|nr:toll/interleukin-1 receptor domain-containing protein [Arcanobacterium pluranimalium]MBM7824698.1 hypothetical protein [Arcanobacterium pluranimalium]